MNTRRDQLEPDRLFEATNAVMAALDEWATEHKGSTIYPLDMMGTPEQPRPLCDFTLFEVQQASEFLVRMGMIQPPHAKQPD